MNIIIPENRTVTNETKLQCDSNNIKSLQSLKNSDVFFKAKLFKIKKTLNH